MDEVQASLWDKRYANSAPDDIEACYALTHYSHLLPDSVDPTLMQQRTALDLACGRGGNALLLASAGFDTHAWDISAVAIEALASYKTDNGQSVWTQPRDVVAEPPVADSFDVIVVSRFLDRSIIPDLIEALRPGGLLVYQTFSMRTSNGPNNPDYLLYENELLALFTALTVRAFEDYGDESFLVAQKPTRGAEANGH